MTMGSYTPKQPCEGRDDGVFFMTKSVGDGVLSYMDEGELEDLEVRECGPRQDNGCQS